MRQDPNLYGQPPPKKQKKEIPLSSSLAFTSQLSSLLATQTSGSAPSTKNTYTNTSSSAISARSRPSKSKTTDLNNVKVKRKAGSSGGHDDARDSHNGKLVLKETHGTEDDAAARLHARRRMESKARLYAAMQRGDYVGREIGLVDFDRKWAEKKDTTPGATVDSYSSDSDSDSDPNIDTEIIEYEDEFGRLRRGTRADKVRHERRLARGEASAVELERMSARPREPQNLIVGDAVQAEAFVSRDDEAMEALARKRDRSASPPPAEHYRADKEIRTKGVGFYAFSRDEATREAEMAALEAERARTEQLKKEREEKAAARRREIEARREEIRGRRAKKLADNFLDGLGMELGAVGRGRGEEKGVEGKGEEDM